MTTRLVVFYGNSLTQGVGASSPSNVYPEVAIATLGSGYVGINEGASGATTTILATNAEADLYAHFSAAYDLNIAVIWEVTNHLYNGAGGVSAATAYSAYADLCQAAHTAGFRVVAVTVLPRSDVGTYAGFNADRALVNTDIRGNWRAFSASALADVAANASIGGDGDSDDTNYYGDGVHMTDAGYAIIAEVVAAAVLRIVSSTRSPLHVRQTASRMGYIWKGRQP